MFVWIYLGCGLVGGRPQGGRGLGRMRRAGGDGQEVHAWWSVGGRAGVIRTIFENDEFFVL